MTQALYFSPSYQRLQSQIKATAPELDVVHYDEEGRFIHEGREVTRGDIDPQWFWIHSELFFSPRLRDYFDIVLESPRAEWLHTINTGLDRLPYLDLVRRGVQVTNNHSQAIPIAEYVLGQVLSHYQDIPEFRERQRRGMWEYRRFREVHDSRWLIIGFGHIGRNIAVRAKAFGARITVLRRRQETEGVAHEVITREMLPEALGKADVVVLACASNEATRNMVDDEFLRAMREGSTLVNIARGDLVDEAALHRALERGVPGYAILDVFNREPPATDSWVWTHPRVSLTPHTSNAGSGMRKRSDRLFLDNLERKVHGKPLLNLVSERDITA